jgi:hypothetical protein
MLENMLSMPHSNPAQFRWTTSTTDSPTTTHVNKNKNNQKASLVFHLHISNNNNNNNNPSVLIAHIPEHGRKGPSAPPRSRTAQLHVRIGIFLPHSTNTTTPTQRDM